MKRTMKKIQCHKCKEFAPMKNQYSNKEEEKRKKKEKEKEKKILKVTMENDEENEFDKLLHEFCFLKVKMIFK